MIIGYTHPSLTGIAGDGKRYYDVAKGAYYLYKEAEGWVETAADGTPISSIIPPTPPIPPVPPTPPVPSKGTSTRKKSTKKVEA